MQRQAIAWRCCISWGRIPTGVRSQHLHRHTLCVHPLAQPPRRDPVMLKQPLRRKSRYAPAVVTKNDLLELLNEDFTRECRAIYAHAVFAERMANRDGELAG